MVDELSCGAYTLVAFFLGVFIGAVMVGHLWHRCAMSDMRQSHDD